MKILKFLFVFFVILLITGGLSAWYILKALSPKINVTTKPVLFHVSQGATMSQLSSALLNKDLIRNRHITTYYAICRGWDRRIMPGYYLLSANMSTASILKKIVEGEIEKIHITIPEGYNIKQISELLESYNFSSQNYFNALKNYVSQYQKPYAFLQQFSENDSLEGYLFPDTYQMGQSEVDLVKQQLTRFNEVIIPAWQNKPKGYPLNLKEALILASIVEKEAQKPEERNLIAGVFFKRLFLGMPLAACPTVEYALGKHREVLTLQDVKVNSPYNTYIYKGLPPTPICNPGIEAFKATLTPGKTSYLYFVSKGNGYHIFSRTAKEHNIAKLILIKAKKKKM